MRAFAQQIPTGLRIHRNGVGAYRCFSQLASVHRHRLVDKAHSKAKAPRITESIRTLSQASDRLTSLSPCQNTASPSALRIRIRMQSHLKITKEIPNAMANQMYASTFKIPSYLESFFCLKKKKKFAITVISGPHVHKKSRDQYFIPKYIAS